jgi:predicted GNAT family acetyltransferase
MAASDNLHPAQFQTRPIEGFPGTAFEAHVDEKRIGEIYVSPANTGGLAVNNIKVEKEHRRRGVAAALYKTASEHNDNAPIDHSPSSMTPVAMKTIRALAPRQPGLHRKVIRDTNGNRRVMRGDFR